MLSSKSEALLKNNSVIRAMFEEGKKLADEFGSENVFDFSLGNPNFPPPPAVNAAIKSVLDSLEPTEVHGYMSNAGFESVRRRVAENLTERFGKPYNAGGIIMTVGAACGLNIVLKTLLDPGDEVVVTAPYFVEYGNYVRNFDGELRTIPATQPDFQPDPEALRAVLSPKTKAVIVNSPNNPTGVVYTTEALASIAAILREKSAEFGHAIYIISDEPYRELIYDGTEVPWIPNIYRDTIVCYSWSKSLSLPGERIGYVALSPDIEGYEDLSQALTISLRVLGFVNAPSLMQLAVANVIDTEPDISGYRENRTVLYDGLTKLGFTCIRPDGAFYLWVKAPDGDDAAFTAAAKAYNILFVPGTSFAGRGYVRIAYCVSKSTITRSLDKFAQLAAKYNLSGAPGI